MTDPDAFVDIEEIISSSHDERSATRRRRTRTALGLSAAFTLGWVIYVTVSGQWDRVADHWASAVTMIFGSFVAGSTPQGGGAVAFPVFTKVLDVPADVARTFSLSIQSAGMTAASLAIIINRRRIVSEGIAIAAPAAVAGFLAGVVLLVRTDLPFGPSELPGAYVKVTFTIIVASMAFVTWLGYRVQILERRESMPAMNARIVALLVICGFLGGVVSVLVGSGADVFVYLALVVLLGLSPRTGVATSVLVMTIVSWLGLIVLGLGDGHLSVDRADGVVTALDGRSVTSVDGMLAWSDTLTGASGAGLDASRFDLFGLWLAAAPVVVWGAPLGSAVSSRITDRQLVRFVVALAALEVISTVIFLDDLRTDVALAIFGAATLVGAFVVLWLLNRSRQRILGLPVLDPEESVSRSDLDVGSRLHEQLEDPA